MTNEELQAIQTILNQMEQRLDQKMDQKLDQMLDQKLSPITDRLTRIELTLENEITSSINALAEGQDLTHQKLKELASKDEVDDLKAEVRLLRRVVAQHSQEIEALKKAQ